MKQPKKLTFSQKRMLSRIGINADEYMFCSETEDTFILWNKAEKKIEEISKKKKKVRESLSENKKNITTG